MTLSSWEMLSTLIQRLFFFYFGLYLRTVAQKKSIIFYERLANINKKCISVFTYLSLIGSISPSES